MDLSEIPHDRIDDQREFQPVCVGSGDIDVDGAIADEIRKFTAGSRSVSTPESRTEHLHRVTRDVLTAEQYSKALRRAEYAVAIATRLDTQLSENPPEATLLTSLLPGYDRESTLFIVRMAAMCVDGVDNPVLQDRLVEKIMFLDVDIALNAVREMNRITDDLDLYIYLYRCIADACVLTDNGDTSLLYTSAAVELVSDKPYHEN